MQNTYCCTQSLPSYPRVPVKNCTRLEYKSIWFEWYRVERDTGIFKCEREPPGWFQLRNSDNNAPGAQCIFDIFAFLKMTTSQPTCSLWCLMISATIRPKMWPAAAIRWKPYLLDLRFQLLTSGTSNGIFISKTGTNTVYICRSTTQIVDLA